MLKVMVIWAYSICIYVYVQYIYGADFFSTLGITEKDVNTAVSLNIPYYYDTVDRLLKVANLYITILA